MPPSTMRKTFKYSIKTQRKARTRANGTSSATNKRMAVSRLAHVTEHAASFLQGKCLTLHRHVFEYHRQLLVVHTLVLNRRPTQGPTIGFSKSGYANSGSHHRQKIEFARRPSVATDEPRRTISADHDVERLSGWVRNCSSGESTRRS